MPETWNLKCIQLAGMQMVGTLSWRFKTGVAVVEDAETNTLVLGKMLTHEGRRLQKET